jgi:hypothetical protein
MWEKACTPSRSARTRSSGGIGNPEQMRQIGYRCRKIGRRWQAWLLVRDEEEKQPDLFRRVFLPLFALSASELQSAGCFLAKADRARLSNSFARRAKPKSPYFTARRLIALAIISAAAVGKVSVSRLIRTVRVAGASWRSTAHADMVPPSQPNALPSQNRHQPPHDCAPAFLPISARKKKCHRCLDDVKAIEHLIDRSEADVLFSRSPHIAPTANRGGYRRRPE